MAYHKVFKCNDDLKLCYYEIFNELYLEFAHDPGADVRKFLALHTFLGKMITFGYISSVRGRKIINRVNRIYHNQFPPQPQKRVQIVGMVTEALERIGPNPKTEQ